MFACICSAVSDDEVSAAAECGADTVEAVGRATDAGTGCGSCHDRLADLICAATGCPLVGARLIA